MSRGGIASLSVGLRTVLIGDATNFLYGGVPRGKCMDNISFWAGPVIGWLATIYSLKAIAMKHRKRTPFWVLLLSSIPCIVLLLLSGELASDPDILEAGAGAITFILALFVYVPSTVFGLLLLAFGVRKAVVTKSKESTAGALQYEPGKSKDSPQKPSNDEEVESLVSKRSISGSLGAADTTSRVLIEDKLHVDPATNGYANMDSSDGQVTRTPSETEERSKEASRNVDTALEADKIPDETETMEERIRKEEEVRLKIRSELYAEQERDKKSRKNPSSEGFWSAKQLKKRRLIAIGALFLVWLSQGAPSPSLYLMVSQIKQDCLEFAEEHKSDLIAFDAGDELSIGSSWVKSGRRVVEIISEGAEDGTLKSRLCIYGKGQIRIPAILEEMLWR